MTAKTATLRVLMTLDAVGGVWRYCMDLGRGLASRGASVAFLGFGPPPSAERVDEARRIGSLDWSDSPLDWMARDRAALAGAPAAIRRAAGRHRADLVHVNLPAHAADLAIGIPVVSVSHSCVTTWFRAVRGTPPPVEWRWQTAANAEGFAASAAVVAPSNSHANLLRQCYGPVPRLRIVSNGTAARPPARRPAAPSVIAIGRWWDDGKDGATLDRAAARLPVAVRMIGATRSPSGASLRLRNADERGELTRDATLAALAEAMVFVSPSRYEPFGLAVAEAARADLPLVLSDIPTFREIWDGAALFFPPGDDCRLGAAVERLLADANLRGDLGAAAAARARHFTVDAQAAAMRRLYDELCGATVPAGA